MARVEGEEALGALRAIETVNAINRGFSPERAFCLLDDEDLLFDVIDLSETADTPNQSTGYVAELSEKTGSHGSR